VSKQADDYFSWRAAVYLQSDNAERLVWVAVTLLALAAAVILFFIANAHPDLLWRGYYHDRNGHYAFGQDLALAVRTGDPVWFFSELLKAQVWPPVHGLVLAAVLLIGGIDHRLGIVPSLIGWMLTIVFVALIARRMFQDRDLGIGAGAIALTLGIASPAFRLLASDVMLESLGAGLSAAALWAYGRAMASRETADDAAQLASRWRLFAIILTALFFEKGNYWGLVVAAIGITHLLNGAAIDYRRWLAKARGIARRADVLGAVRVLLDPFIIVAALLGGVVLYLYHRGPTSIVLLGRAVSLYPPETFVTVTYAVLYVRFALSWLRNRQIWNAALGPAGRVLFYWHVTPIAVSFLLPRRLSAFIWFVGPANANTGFDPLGGVVLYWHAFADGFSATPEAALLTLGLFAIGLSQLRRFSPGGRAAFVLALVGFAGVVIHPQHQARFLASWVFAVWIGAGAGGAILLERLMPRRAWLPLAGAAAIVLAAALWRTSPTAAYATAIYPTSGPSDLDLVRPVLRDFDGLHSIGYATTFGESSLLSWMAREHCRCKLDVEKPWISMASRQEVRTLMADRIASSHTQAFVIIDAPTGYYQLPELGWTYDRMVGILDAMAEQHRYVRVATHAVPEFGAEVSLWRLRDGASGE
jgi:hypothetical protein